MVDDYMGTCFEGETAPRVKELAARLRLSREQVSRAFLASTGTPLSNYFVRAQLEHSKRLLANSNLSVTAIAYRSGFENRRTFFRFFKRTTSETPSEYRARARNVPSSASA
jgi:two-component system response regulator YesN